MRTRLENNEWTDKEMGIRFGVSPIAWSNDDLPELGGDTPLTVCLQDAAGIGFEGIELGNKFPREPQQLRRVLKTHRLDLVGGWYSGALLTRESAAEIEALQDHLALLKAMHCTVFIFAECSNAVHGIRDHSMRSKPVLDDAAWATFGKRLTEVADYIALEGLKFAYHHHTGTVVETATELDRLLAETGQNTGLTLDTGHAFVGGIDCSALIRSHPERVVHVHCKDVRAALLQDVRARHKSFLDGVIDGIFTVPGDGDIDFEPVMQALADVEYSGWIIVEAEQDPAKANPREYANLGLEHLQNCAQRAGLTGKAA